MKSDYTTSATMVVGPLPVRVWVCMRSALLGEDSLYSKMDTITLVTCTWQSCVNIQHLIFHRHIWMARPWLGYFCLPQDKVLINWPSCLVMHMCRVDWAITQSAACHYPLYTWTWRLTGYRGSDQSNFEQPL